MLRKGIAAAILGVALTLPATADEGMWLPFALQGELMEKMREAGLRLDAGDIYRPDTASLSDAVVGLGTEGRPFRHFCTGGLVSGQGLFITNHHCGYNYIQSHSTLQHDYLTDGFWAYTLAEELTNTGLTASILRRMEDVTARALAGTEGLEGEAADSALAANIAAIEAQAVEGTHLRAKVNPFYGGNEYYLSVYEIFTDVRLVGAPPSAIGKFGGDTDNWAWPRHTGDFSIFRIYAGPDNKPAPYSAENVPYRPDKHFEINTEGLKEGDFTFVMGYPGTTREYLPSHAIEYQQEVYNPIAIALAQERIETMKAFMEQDRGVRIQYSGKVAGAANGWKKSIGENLGLARFGVADLKREQERAFEAYAQANPGQGLADILPAYREAYARMSELIPTLLHYSHGALQVEASQLAGQMKALRRGDTLTDERRQALREAARAFFKDYHRPVDERIFAQMMARFDAAVPAADQPEEWRRLRGKHKGDHAAIARWVFDRTIYADSARLLAAIDSYQPKQAKALAADPMGALRDQLAGRYNELWDKMSGVSGQLPALHKRYIAALRAMEPGRQRFPDANSTFRVAYGKTAGYRPADGVAYTWQTTLDGIMEKDNPEIYDYDVPQRLRELATGADFGPYATPGGQLPVCFAATNHTTGGNSGSPVLDAQGRLLGLNFDRAWEGVMSDLHYEPGICRNIGVDIRYVLFVVDRYAGARNLIDEINAGR